MNVINMSARDPIQLFGDDPSNPDLLIPELRPFFEKRGGKLGWPMLRSPLVYQIPFMSWKLANDQHAAKTEAIAKRLAEGRYAAALPFYERPYRMTMLLQWWPELDEAQQREMLRDTWIDTEYPHQFGYRNIVRLFRETGYLHDNASGDPEGAPQWAPNHVTVYRGCLPSHKRGMSWTLSRNRAAWFAKRLNGDDGRIYKAVVGERNILAMFFGRNEDEVVVDPFRMALEEA